MASVNDVEVPRNWRKFGRFVPCFGQKVKYMWGNVSSFIVLVLLDFFFGSYEKTWEPPVDFASFSNDCSNHVLNFS